MTASSAVSRDGFDFRVLEAAPGSYLVLSPKLRIVAANGSFLKATSTVSEDILGRHLFEAFPENPAAPEAGLVAKITSSIHRVIQNRVPDAMEIQRYDLRKSENEGGGFEERHWAFINSPVIGDSGEVAYIISRVEDLTEFVRLKRASTESGELAESLRSRTYQAEAELYLRAAQIAEGNRLRLDAMGRMAGGIAHDFSNLLNIVLGYTKLLQSDIPEDNSAKKGLAAIERAAETATGLTRQLLAFSSQQILEPRVVNPNELIIGIESLIRGIVGNRIQLDTTLHRELGSIRVDPTQFEQVIINLVINSRDAMPRGGHLSIETRNVELDESYVLDHPGVPPGQYVGVTVSDTGVGISRELQSQIFEPFFTTKKGKGTGLGLSTVYGIVRQSGGYVSVYSEPGMGTSFRIYFPVVSGSIEKPAAVKDDALPEGGGETILLVEDRGPLRELFQSMLERGGYRLLTAGTPGEALQIAASYPDTIHLLITDVVLPEMTGPELAERYRTTRQESEVLFVSAFTESVISRQGKLSPGVNFLQKPVSHDVLIRKIRGILRKRQSSSDNHSIPAKPEN